MRTSILVITLIIGIGGCATNSKQVVEDDGISTAVNINGSIYINIPEQSSSKKYIVNIYSAANSLVMTREIENNDVISLCNLPNGIYFLELTGQEKIIKIIKQ